MIGLGLWTSSKYPIGCGNVWYELWPVSLLMTLATHFNLNLTILLFYSLFVFSYLFTYFTIEFVELVIQFEKPCLKYMPPNRLHYSAATIFLELINQSGYFNCFIFCTSFSLISFLVADP